MARAVAVPLADGVWRIPTAVGDLANAYAFRDPDGGITLVDAGRWRAAGRLRAGLAAIGSTPADVLRVVVTHARVDAVGGLAALAAGTGAAVACHEREAPYLRDGRTPRTARGRVSTIPPAPAAAEFLDGELLPAGLRVVHTPGVTPGHVCLLHEPTGVLVTGDALVNVRGVRYPPGWMCTAPAVHRRSVAALADLDFEVAAFSHGPEIRRRAREVVRAFLDGRPGRTR